MCGGHRQKIVVGPMSRESALSPILCFVKVLPVYVILWFFCEIQNKLNKHKKMFRNKYRTNPLYGTLVREQLIKQDRF